MSEMSETTAVCLCSGGLDSTTVLALGRERGLRLLGLTFDYGQRHRREVEAARRIARHYGAAEHLVLDLDLRAIGGSALTAEVEVPRDRSAAEIGTGVPATYVPFRNSILLSIAVAWAESRGAQRVLFGANHLDSSGYPDCRPAYIEAFNELVRRGSRAGDEGRPLRVDAPLLDMDKAAIVREGVRLGVPFELTWSCYEGGERACGRCDACLLRLKGFREAGVADPLPYDAPS